MNRNVSQTTLILHALKEGRRLTPAKAFFAFGCQRLAARIADLRDAGYPITTVLRTGPNGKRYAEYQLNS